MSVKFTPAPWAVNPFNAQVDAMPSATPVCQLLWPTDLRSEDVTEANARLIAAAPDGFYAAEAAYVAMLQCEDFTWRINNQAALVKLREFIAKATGDDSEAVQNRYEAIARVGRS